MSLHLTKRWDNVMLEKLKANTFERREDVKEKTLQSKNIIYLRI
jgi:hypothetical protein